MCGRFTLSVDPVELQMEFQIPDIPAEWHPRFNIAPTQPVAVLLDGKTKALEFLRWGLIPSWAKDMTIGSRMINARSETLLEKPSFRAAFTRRRCLILADGFYEWKRDGKGASIPYRFTLANKKPFAFAGLWESWHHPDGSELRSCTIITCAANETVAEVHDRMPVIFDAESCWRWLEESDTKKLQTLLLPYPAERLSLNKVGKAINNPAFEGAECIEPVVG